MKTLRVGYILGLIKYKVNDHFQTNFIALYKEVYVAESFSVTVSDKDSKGTILQTPWNVLENFCLKAHGGCAKHCRSDPYKPVMGKRNWALLVISSGFSLVDDSGSLPFFSHPLNILIPVLSISANDDH